MPEDPTDPVVGRASEARSVGAAVAIARNIRTAEGESTTERIVTQPHPVPQPAPQPQPPRTTPLRPTPPTHAYPVYAERLAAARPPRETPPISTVQPPPQVQRIIENVQRLREVSEQLITAIKSGNPQEVTRAIQQASGAPPEVRVATPPREVTAPIEHVTPPTQPRTVQLPPTATPPVTHGTAPAAAPTTHTATHAPTPVTSTPSREAGGAVTPPAHTVAVTGLTGGGVQHATTPVATPGGAAGGAVGGPPHMIAPIAVISPPPQIQSIIENVQRLREVTEQLSNAARSGNTQEVQQHANTVREVANQLAESATQLAAIAPQVVELQRIIENAQRLRETSEHLAESARSGNLQEVLQHVERIREVNEQLARTVPTPPGVTTVTGVTGVVVRGGAPPGVAVPIAVEHLPRWMQETWLRSPQFAVQLQNLERLASELAKTDPELANRLRNILNTIRSEMAVGNVTAVFQLLPAINGIIRQATAPQAETAAVQLPNGQVVEMPVSAANVFTSLNREQQYDAMRIYYNLTMKGVNPNTAWMEAVEQARHWTGVGNVVRTPTTTTGGGATATQWVSYKIPGTDVTVNVPSNLASQFESLSPAKQYMIYSTLSATHQLTNYDAWVNALSWGQVMSEKSAEQAAVASIAAKGGDKAVEQFKSTLNEYKAAKSDPSSPTVTITVTGTATGATPQFTVPPNLQQQFNQLVQQFMSEGMSQLDAEVAAAKALGIQVTYPTVTVTGAITLANPNAVDSGLYNNLISLGSKGDTRAFSQLWGQTFEKAAQLAKQGNYDQAYLLLNTLTQAYNYLVRQGVIVNGIFAVPNAINSGLPQWDLAINARNQVFNYINGQGFSSFMSWVNKQLADAVQSGNPTQAAALINAATQALNDLKQSDPSLYQSINGDKLLNQLQSSGSQAIVLATVNAYISSYTSAPDALSKEAVASGLIQFLNDLKAKDPAVFNAINGDQLLAQAQQGFAGAVYSYVNTVLKLANGNVSAAENAANSGSYESALNHVDSAAYYYNTAKSILEALAKDPTVTDPSVKAAVAQGLQGINNALAQLQQLKANIQVNQYYTTVLQPLLNQYNTAAKSGDPVAIYNAASALVSAINTLSQSNPQLYKAVNQLVQESTGMTLGNIASFLQQKVLSNQYLKTINDAVSNLQTQLAANPQLATQLGLPFGVSPRTSQMTSEVAEGIVLSALSTIVPIVSNLYAVYMANTYRGPNGQLQLIPGAAQTVAQAFDQAWNALAGYAGWLNSIGLGNLVIGTDPSGKPITLSQFINNLREERRNLDAYVATNNLVSWFNSVVNGYVENPQGTILSAGVAQLNQYIQQFNQTGDPKYLQQAQQYAQQLLNVLNMGGVNRQAIQNAINTVQQSNIDNKQQVLQGLQAMLQFYDNLSQIAVQGLLTQQQAYAQQYMYNLIQNLNGAFTNLNDPETQQFLSKLNNLNIPNINKQLIYQYFNSMKVGDYLAGKTAEWLSTLPEPLRMALGFTYGMGEWINKLGLTLASFASLPATSLASAFGGLVLYPLGLGIQMLSPRTTPNPVLQAATWAMNLPWQVQGLITSPERQMNEISKAFALTTPSITLPDSWLLRDALSALGVDYNVAKVGKVSVIKLNPVSFGTLASSILFLVFPVVGDITSGVARLTEALADPGGFLASLQRIGAPDAVISNVAKLLNWAAGSPEAQASLYNIARSLYSVSDAVRNLDFFTPIFDEVAPYAARALGKLWDALGKVSPNLQQMAINAANRVLQTAPNVAYPSSFINIGLRWLVGADIGFFIGSQVGAHVPVSLGPEWSSTYNEWMKQWLFGIVGALIGGGVAAFGTPGLIREVYALTGDPVTGDLLASAFEKADNLGIRGIPAQVTIALAAAARAPSIFITRLVTTFNKWRGVNPSYDDMLVSIREAVENGVDNAKAGKLIEGGYINPIYLDAVRAQAENLVLHGLDINPGEVGIVAASYIRDIDPNLATNLASVIAEQVREAVEDGLSRGLSLRSVLVDLSGIKDVKQLDSYFQDSLTRYLSNYLGEKNAKFIVGKIMDAVKNGNEEDAILLLEQTLRPGVGEYGQWLREFRDALLNGDFSRALELLQYPVARQPFEQAYALYQGAATNLPPSWEVNVVEDYIDEYFNARKSILEGVRPPTAGVKPQPTSQVFQASSDVKQAANDLYQRLNQVLANAPDDVRNAVSPIIEELRGVQNPGDLDLALAQLREELGRLSVSNPDAMPFIIAVETLLKDFEYANRDLLYPLTTQAAADVLRSIADKAPDAVKPELEKAVDALSRGDPGALSALVSTLKEQAKADPSVLPILDVASELQQRLTPPPSAVTAGLTATAAMQQPPATQQQAPPQAAQPTQPAVAGTGGALAAQLMMQPQANVEALLKQLPQLNQSPETVEQLRNIFSSSADVLYITNRLSEEREIVNVFKSLGITPKVFVNALEKAGYQVPDAIKDAAASSNTWEEFFEKIRNILPERQPEEYYTEEAQKPGWTGPSGPTPPVRPRQPGEIEVGVPMAPRGSAREVAGTTGEYAAAPGAPTATAPYTVGRFPGMPTIELMPLVVGIPPIPAIYVSQLTQQQYGQATTTTTTGPPAEMPQQPPELVGPGVPPMTTGFLWPIATAGAGQRPGRKTRGVYEVLTI